ncbi:MAG: hypothetical protein M3032_05530 [Verrucomicrobiota bacterium]|nr:hypothetical protein [Verrucomicrobiota bacterium]
MKRASLFVSDLRHLRALPRFSLVFFLSLGALLQGAAEPVVQLLLPPRALEPKSTFEVRFASETVPLEEVGKPATVSPLVFQPPVDGSFVWLSTRSGSFAPKSVLPLGTRFPDHDRAG